MRKKLLVVLCGLCFVFLAACGDKEAAETTANVPEISEAETVVSETADEDSEGEQVGLEESEEDSEESENDDMASQETEEDAADTNEGLVDGMHPEFKEAMDSYEAFYDKYCDTLKKYAENPADLQLIADYADVMAKSTEVTENFEAWDEGELNEKELQYYLEVNSRVTQKILEVSK